MVIVCVALVAHNFTQLDSGRADYGFLAFRELSQFVSWLLQKIKHSSDLPVIEKWAACLLPNLSCLGAIEKEHFLNETRLLSPLKKTNSSFVQKKFRKNCQRFLEDLVSTIMSTVAGQSPVGQGQTWFLPRNQDWRWWLSSFSPLRATARWVTWAWPG